MIDPQTLVRTFLAGRAELTSLVGERIYAGRERPPVGYSPADGPCIAFKVRGGQPDYDDALLLPSMQFTCWAGSEEASYEVYRALYDALHNGHSASILRGLSEVLGQVAEEAETGWYFTFAAFKLMLRTS